MYFVKRKTRAKKMAIPQNADAPRKNAYPHAATNEPQNPAIKMPNATKRPTIVLGFPRIVVVLFVIFSKK